MRRKLGLLVLGILGLIVAPTRHVKAAELRDLHSLDELRTLVNRDKTTPRVVLLLSPT